MPGQYLTRSQFISKARLVHGDRYGYQFVRYIHSQTKVKIECKEHGYFEQRPTSHLAGHGCYDCKAKKISQTLARSQETFISKALQIHGNRYDYSLVNYINEYTDIKLICSVHGEFNVKPNVHLRGSNCRKCRVYFSSMSEEDRQIKRRLPEYEQWRKAVYERDNYTCQKCQQRGGNIHAHHIYKYSEYKDLRFDVDNGIVLCQTCHYLYHSQFNAVEISKYSLKVFLERIDNYRIKR